MAAIAYTLTCISADPTPAISLRTMEISMNMSLVLTFLTQNRSILHNQTQPYLQSNVKETYTAKDSNVTIVSSSKTNKGSSTDIWR